MKLTDKVYEVENKKSVTEKQIKTFYESLDYSKAVVDTDRLYIKVKFNDGIIKIKDFPFPTEEESCKIYEHMGIHDVVTNYSKNGSECFKLFEFSVDKVKMNCNWYMD